MRGRFGVRFGKWPTLSPAQALLNTPHITTTQGLRERVLVAVLLGCTLRRCEAALTDGRSSGGFTPEATVAARRGTCQCGWVRSPTALLRVPCGFSALRGVPGSVSSPITSAIRKLAATATDNGLAGAGTTDNGRREPELAAGIWLREALAVLAQISVRCVTLPRRLSTGTGVATWRYAILCASVLAATRYCCRATGNSH